ncbi:proprotein convertase P-domain-containing protein [Pseudoblastomonas halimionae]|nr:proprotein convertase P-domain-containing protein [Alteriqipengyuania halimionae]
MKETHFSLSARLKIARKQKVQPDLYTTLTMFPYQEGMDDGVCSTAWDGWQGAALHACLVVLFLLLPTTLFAQAVNTYSNPTTGTINSGTPCSNALARTFNVSGTNYTIADVNLGILVTHSWRGDLRFILQSPTGTRVQMTEGDTSNGGISGNNFNVLLDDSAGQFVNTDGNANSHSTSAPPYQNTFRPRNPLSAFNGENANGVWRLEICDMYPQADDGSFRRADLYLTALPTNYADLSLTKTLVSATPSNGGNANWRLTVTNSGSSPMTANGVSVRDDLPAGFTFQSASGAGSYDPVSGIWTVGSIAPGQSRSIDVTGSISATAGVRISSAAEIISSSVPDSDSTVNNGLASEDDYATNSFVVAGTRAAGIPPNLTCPAGSVVFDWDTRSWAAGSTNNSFPLASIGTIGFMLNNPGSWLNNNSLGGQSPNRQNAMDGGTNEYALIQVVNLNNTDEVVTTTISLPMVMRGARFAVFDVDYGANQFADRIRVEGRYKGATVIPILTNGETNYVIGNEAFGDGVSDTPDPDGNVVVTFNSPIDAIVIEYGNHRNVPSPVINPGQQGIAIHDITFCRPTTDLTVLKTSSVLSDPVNGTNNPRAIPGARMKYCLLFNNTGDNAATDVIARDTLPTGISYVAGTMKSGTSCANANSAEDNNASGGDESDPFGASISGREITATTATLAAGAAFALTFEALVD